MTTSLWPDFPDEVKPRGMRQILEEAGGDIEQKTRGKILFRVKTYTEREKLYHDCYLVLTHVDYLHLLFRVTTGVAPFPAALVTTDGQEFRDIRDEGALREILERHFHSKEIRVLVNNLLGVFEGASRQS